MSETPDQSKPTEKQPKTTLVAAESPNKTKMVKIKALRDCQLDRDTLLQVGETAEVPEAVANEFLKPFENYYGSGGEWSEASAAGQPIYRATLVQ